jgi:hypothetical protein
MSPKKQSLAKHDDFDDYQASHFLAAPKRPQVVPFQSPNDNRQIDGTSRYSENAIVVAVAQAQRIRAGMFPENAPAAIEINGLGAYCRRVS